MSLPQSTIRMLRRSLLSSLRQPFHSQPSHSHLLTLHSRFLHPARSRHSPSTAPATTDSVSSPATTASSSSASSSSASPSITIVNASTQDWEQRYNDLKQKRSADAISRWEELQTEFPDVDFPSPDGTERPSKRVVSVVNKLLNLTLLESFQLARLMDETYGGGGGGGGVDEGSAQQSGGQVSGGAAGVKAGAEKKEEKAAEAKTSFSVRLDGFGAADKIKVIKEVRTATGLGLKESKELVEGAPKTIKKDLSKADCDALVAKLKEAGAKVTVE